MEYKIALGKYSDVIDKINNSEWCIVNSGELYIKAEQDYSDISKHKQIRTQSLGRWVNMSECMVRIRMDALQEIVSDAGKRIILTLTYLPEDSASVKNSRRHITQNIALYRVEVHEDEYDGIGFEEIVEIKKMRRYIPDEPRFELSQPNIVVSDPRTSEMVGFMRKIRTMFN